MLYLQGNYKVNFLCMGLYCTYKCVPTSACQMQMGMQLALHYLAHGQYRSAISSLPSSDMGRTLTDSRSCNLFHSFTRGPTAGTISFRASLSKSHKATSSI